MEKQIPYGLKITFLVHVIVGGIFGLVFLLIPEVFGSMMGAPIKDPPTMRLLGAALIAFAASSWFAYRETVWERVKIVIQMEIVWTILVVPAMLYDLVSQRVTG